MSDNDLSSSLLADKSLSLFFTFRVRMEIWEDVGFLEREAALYNRLAEYFESIYLFTYGDKSDKQFEDYFADNIEIIPQKNIQNDHLYSLLIPLYQRDILSDVDLIKTNQMKGSWSAVLSKYLYHVPLVVRTGFILTIFADKQERSQMIQRVFTLIEWIAYSTGDGVMSPSPEAFEYVENRYSPRGKHECIPNYVETDVFKPMNEVLMREKSICFVGRLGDQKNVLSLIKSLEDTDYALTLVGEGPLEDEIRTLADDLCVNVKFKGNVPNHEIPTILNKHEIFVLPSLYEGMPKALLEAMSCGLPVIGTDVEGTREVITDGKNGLLCDTSPDSIAKAISQLMENPSQRRQLGANARETIVEEYSLDSLVQQEISLYIDLLESN